jgi:predicted XRE-type DNA-binding protein
MAFDEQAFMAERHQAAEHELGMAIAPEDYESGAIIRPGENPFEALGLANATEREAKMRLAKRFTDLVRRRELKQIQVAALTGLSQSDVSKLLRGQVRGFSEARLRELLAALGMDVRMVLQFHERADHSAGTVELVEA